MAKPNYVFAKRQRDLAKKQKKEDKQKLKSAAQKPPTPDDALSPPIADKTSAT